MRKGLWLLLLLPLLAGCGAGLKEEGRLPVSNPLGRGRGETVEMTVESRSRNDSPATKQAIANYTGSFANTSTNITITNVRRFILCQRIEAAVVQAPEGATLPNTIKVNNFRLRATFRDNLAQVTFDVSMTGIVTMTLTTGNNYSVTVQGAGNDPCLGATVESGDLNTLAQIVTQGGDNSVEVTLEADVTSNPGLPDGTRLIFTTGLGTGTLEL
jgi:hypothetical protein